MAGGVYKGEGYNNKDWEESLVVCVCVCKGGEGAVIWVQYKGEGHL